MTETKTAVTTKKEDSHTKEMDKIYAAFSLLPQASAALTIGKIIPPINSDNRSEWKPTFADLWQELNDQTTRLKKGNLGRMEGMLLSQAHTLDLLFNSEVRRAMSADRYDVLKLRMDIALKAQRQCRATVETLAIMKNPQPYVRQQNVAMNQQINNGVSAASPPARGKNTKSQNELLEHSNDEWLDTRTATEAGGIDQELETVGAQHRRKN